MNYIESPALNCIQLDFLTERIVGNVILNGKIETFDFFGKKSAQPSSNIGNVAESNQRQSFRPRAYSCGVFVPKRTGRKRSSSLGDLSKPSARKLFLDLISTMNEAFPDYDFALTRHEQFVDSDVLTAMAEVNGFLSELTVDDPNVLEKLWKGLDDVINLMKCEVFTYLSNGEDVGPLMDTDGALWSFNYFFYNDELKRICFFSCVAVSKFCKMHYLLNTSGLDDSDMLLLGNEDEDGASENDEDDDDKCDVAQRAEDGNDDENMDEGDLPDWDGII